MDIALLSSYGGIVGSALLAALLLLLIEGVLHMNMVVVVSVG